MPRTAMCQAETVYEQSSSKSPGERLAVAPGSDNRASALALRTHTLYRREVLKTQLVRLLVASLLAFLATSSAHALSCQKIAEEQSLALLDEAVLIFDGEIVSVSSQPGAPDGSPMAEARIIELYKGETPSDFVSFQVPGRIIRSPEVPELPGLDLGEGDRGLVILHEGNDSFVQKNIGCHLPWPEHLEQLRGERE